MTIQLADVIASVVLDTLGNGLLGTYLLQRQRAEHELPGDRYASAETPLIL
jgi:hypothetical protein